MEKVYSPSTEIATTRAKVAAAARPTTNASESSKAMAPGYLTCHGPRKDVILVDACDRNGVAPEIATPQFYLSARRRLTLNGVLVMNICGDAYQRADHFGRLCGVFGQRVIALPVRDDGNLIALAFRSEAAVRNWDRLERLAVTLRGCFGLNFPGCVRRMSRSPTVTLLRAPT